MESLKTKNQVLKTEKDKEEAKHEEERGELLEKQGKELQDLGESPPLDCGKELQDLGECPKLCSMQSTWQGTAGPSVCRSARNPGRNRVESAPVFL